VFVAEVAVYLNPCRNARETGHTVATHLLESVSHIKSTPFIARVT